MNKIILFLTASLSDTTRLRLDKKMREKKSGFEGLSKNLLFTNNRRVAQGRCSAYAQIS